MYEGITFDDFLKVGVWEKRGWCWCAAVRGAPGAAGWPGGGRHLRRKRSRLDTALNTISNWFYPFLLKNTPTWSKPFKQDKRAYDENSVSLPYTPSQKQSPPGAGF